MGKEYNIKTFLSSRFLILKK